MKNLQKITLCAVSMAISLVTTAQTPGDLLKLSQNNYSFGTARSAALGGAFTSLGADLSSININPAGLGMYRSSDVGLSFSVTSSTMQSSYLNNSFNKSKTKFSLGNVGAAFNVYEGLGGITSVTIGVSYNKLADFNTDFYAAGSNSSSSILDYFALQAKGYKASQLGATDSDPYMAFRNLPIDRWGAALAYQTWLLDPVSNDVNNENYISVLYGNDKVNPSQRMLSKGSIGEYSFSTGLNIQNILYLGVTIGVQDIYFNNRSIYSEGVSSAEPAQNLLGFDYIRSLRINGGGVNFKFGATVSPVKNLKIGVAVHTPTFISLDEEYYEGMNSFFKTNSDNRSLQSMYLVNNYDMSSPTRLLGGISYALPGVGLITADYERAWYNGIRIKDTGDWKFEEGVKNEVLDLFRAANNFRAGLELTPTNNLYLRAGYAYYGDCMKINDAIFNNQANITSYSNYSGGIGYRFGNSYLDLTYIYTDYKYAPYDIYYSDKFHSSAVGSKQNRHTVSLSMGTRF